MYTTHSFSISPRETNTFVYFTKTVLPFEMDYTFDPIQSVSIQVLQEVFGGTARELLQSQNNMSIENALGNNIQVKISFTKSLEYLGNEKLE